jgi:hypothetical protein
MDCQKLSLEACSHAAQNERLPLRAIVQVLFFDQLQLRSSIAECLMASEPLESGSGQLGGLPVSAGEHHHRAGWPLAASENRTLREGMDSMKQRVAELEKACSAMRQDVERLGRSRSAGKSRFPFLPRSVKPQICSAKQAVPATSKAATAGEDKLAVAKSRTSSGGGTPRLKLGRHKNLSVDA